MYLSPYFTRRTLKEDENTRTFSHFFRGNLKVKALPAPGSLSADTLPP
jgi:hypothetical protein